MTDNPDSPTRDAQVVRDHLVADHPDSLDDLDEFIAEQRQDPDFVLAQEAVAEARSKWAVQCGRWHRRWRHSPHYWELQPDDDSPAVVMAWCTGYPEREVTFRG